MWCSVETMASIVPQDKDNRSLVCNGLCSGIDHRKCIKFMVVNACDICCLVALEDDFGIVAKHTAVCSSVCQCTSFASLDRMLGSVCLVRSTLGFLLGLACSKSEC